MNTKFNTIIGAIDITHSLKIIPLAQSVEHFYDMEKVAGSVPAGDTSLVEIAYVKNSENGEITMFFGNKSGGPIVTGKNIEEAKIKFREATGVSVIIDKIVNCKDHERLKRYN